MILFDFFRAGAYESHKKWMFSKLPKMVPCMACFSYGIVATTSDMTRTYEMENSNFPLLSCMGIPRVNGLEVKMRKLTQNMRKEWRRKVNKIWIFIKNEPVNLTISDLAFR